MTCRWLQILLNGFPMISIDSTNVHHWLPNFYFRSQSLDSRRAGGDHAFSARPWRLNVWLESIIHRESFKKESERGWQRRCDVGWTDWDESPIYGVARNREISPCCCNFSFGRVGLQMRRTRMDSRPIQSYLLTYWWTSLLVDHCISQLHCKICSSPREEIGHASESLTWYAFLRVRRRRRPIRKMIDSEKRASSPSIPPSLRANYSRSCGLRVGNYPICCFV